MIIRHPKQFLRVFFQVVFSIHLQKLPALSGKLVKFDQIRTPNQEWFGDCGRDGQCGQWWPLFHRCSNVVTATLGMGNAWIQWNVYTKSYRYILRGPEALCLRASPRSSSEPLYKRLLVQQGAVLENFHEDVTSSTMEAVS